MTPKLNFNILNPAWVVGFIDGEGTFFVAVQKNTTLALGYQVQLQFSVSQHIRDIVLMNQFISFFGAGTVVSDGLSKVQYRMRRFNDFEPSLFPLLDQFPLLTQKRFDAEAFRRVYTMMKSGQYLTQEGLDSIIAIKATMNNRRVYSPYRRGYDDIVLKFYFKRT